MSSKQARKRPDCRSNNYASNGKRAEGKKKNCWSHSQAATHTSVACLDVRGRERSHVLFSFFFSSTDLFLSKFRQSIAKESYDQLDSSGDIYEKTCESFLVLKIDSCYLIQRTSSERCTILMHRLICSEIPGSSHHWCS